MKYLSIIIFLITSWNLSAQQQLLTPYSGTLSSTAQQTLQYYQADTTLTQIGIYEVNGKAFYENTLNVNFGTQSFQFFLDRRDEVAMRKVWQGTSIWGDKINVIYTGSQANITISSVNFNTYKVYRLENNIHGCFERAEIIDLEADCEVSNDDEREMTNHEKNGDKEFIETHCPVRVGIVITQSLLSNTSQDDIDAIINARIDESNEVYINSQSNGLFKGIELDLAFVQLIPDYSEFENSANTETKSTKEILREFKRTSDGELDEVHISRNYYDADFCGIIPDDFGLPKDELIGGRADALNANYEKGFFVAGYNRVRRRRILTFTHEVGHLFGCHHNWSNSWFIVGAFYNGHGYLNIEERWRTVMSYPYKRGQITQQIDGSVGFSKEYCHCTRTLFHSNPQLTASDILTIDDVHDNSIPVGSTSPLGTNNYSFCINKIAREYSSHINHEQTIFDKPNTMIRTDGINGQSITNMPSILPYDDNILFADLIAINNISFSNISRITDGYSRTIRAGNAIDINSSSNSNFEFDAQIGSEVDIKIIDFAETPEECQPGTAKSNNREENTVEIINIERISISPNPAYNNVKIQYNLEQNSIINLWIIDYLGRTVEIIERDILKNKGDQNKIINVQDLSAGTYYVNLTIDGKKITKKLIIIK